MDIRQIGIEVEDGMVILTRETFMEDGPDMVIFPVYQWDLVKEIIEHEIVLKR